MSTQLDLSEDYPLVDGKFLLDAGQSDRGWHRLMSGLQCPQLLAYKEKLRIVFPDRGVLVRGGLTHLGLAHYRKREQLIQRGLDPEIVWSPMDAIAIGARLADSRPEAPQSSPGFYQAPEGESPRAYRHPRGVASTDHVEECQRAVRAYANYWGGREDYEIVAVEAQFRALVPEMGWSVDPNLKAWLFTQRLDLLLRDKAGFYYADDYKTRGRKDKRAERAYARSGQFQGYHVFGLDAFGAHWGGCLIDFITFEGKGFSFQRWSPPVLPWRIRNFADTVRHGERVWQDLEQRDIDPWLYPKVGIDNGCCEHRYGECDGASLCDYGPAGAPAMQADDWEL